jgi:hypothetical protein
MQVIWSDVPPEISKYQLGQKYRIPLWELVYHDCVVAQWYWGDYNNKLPAVWDKRDLFNILYGTPPMYMFDKKLWNENKNKFADSYKKTVVVAKKTGYFEMIRHKYLTSDRNVQETQFSNGTRITVNFSDKPYLTEKGITVKPSGYLIE